MKSLDRDGASVECSVCLDSAEGDQLTLTSCGHLFHEACIKAAMDLNGLCPECRSEVRNPGGLIKVAALKEDEQGGAGDIRRYGSKLCAILTRAQELAAEDAHCKIIVFVQWENL